MKKILYFSLFLILFQGANLFAVRSGHVDFSYSTNKGIDLKMIDSQIESLGDLKDHYLAKAVRLRNRGDRLQFNSREDGLIAAQKDWKSADYYDRMADQIQDEIENLRDERSEVEKKSEY